MKNHFFAFLLLLGFGILQSCVNVASNSYVSDDLYDEANRSVQIAKVKAAKAEKDKKYLDFQDLDESEAEIIEEEEVDFKDDRTYLKILIFNKSDNTLRQTIIIKQQ